MRLDTLILNVAKCLIISLYQVLYDMVYFGVSTAVYIMCLICEIPCYIDFLLMLLRYGVLPIKMLYDTIGPEIKDTRNYSVCLDTQFKVKRGEEIKQLPALVQTQIRITM